MQLGLQRGYTEVVSDHGTVCLTYQQTNGDSHNTKMVTWKKLYRTEQQGAFGLSFFP